MKTQKIRKVISVLVAAGIVTAMYAPSFAEESKSIGSSEYDNADIISEMGTPEFREQLDVALSKANALISESGENGKVSVPISGDLLLTITNVSKPIEFQSGSISPTATAQTKTFYSEFEISDVITPVVYVTYTGYGTFTYDNVNSTPKDSFGVYTAAIFWNVDLNSVFLSSTGTTSYVRNGFSASMDIGIDPIDIKVVSLHAECKLTCDAKGSCTASWLY